MFYYKHHIGDFRSGTANMSRQERWLYRDMLDVYYDKESALPNDLQDVCDSIGATDEESKAVAKILRLKFNQGETGWVHDRCESELSVYRENADVARQNGKKGGRPRKITHPVTSGMPSGTQQEPSGNPEESGSQANHKPLTTNQEPLKAEAPAKRSSDASGSRLPNDWKPSPEDTEYCKTERPDLLPSKVAQNFYDYWIAKPGKDGRKTDWSATWRSWVRKEDSKAAGKPGSVPAQSLKWNPNGQDRSADAAFAAESFKRFGKTGPFTDEELEI